jgi:hypothetical protein
LAAPSSVPEQAASSRKRGRVRMGASVCGL